MSAPKPRKTKHKTPPGQPAAGPSTAKDQSGHHPRKLDFRKPLQGKVFYLDLIGQRKTVQQQKLKSELEELGGTVETFLSKDVTCVISDRPEVKAAGKGSKVKGAPSGTSPAVSTPSPFHQGRDGLPGTADSPSNVIQGSRVVTRGKAIVQKATKSQMFGTSDVLANARNWNVPIKHLDVVLKYIIREKEKFKHSSKDKAKAKKDKQSTTAKERHLTKPYLKAEDVTRRYRPINKEFTTWPRVLLDTRRGSCPYDPTTRNESHVQEAERTQDRPEASQRTPDARHKEVPTKSQSLSRTVAGKALKRRESAAKNKACKKGYCEYCSVKYNQLEKHLQSEQHKRLVSEQNNYFNLDSMIAEGPNLDRFLEDCVRFQNVNTAPPSTLETVEEHDNEDEVILLTNSTAPVEGCTSREHENVNQERSSGKQSKRSPAKRSRSLAKRSRGPTKCGRSPQKSAERGDGDIVTRTEIEITEPVCTSVELQNRLTGRDGDAGDIPEVASDISVEAEVAKMTNHKQANAAANKRSRSRKRRSGGNKELSGAKKRNVLQEEDTGDSKDVNLAMGEVLGETSGTVLRGIAGDEERIPVEVCGQEVMITRVSREELGCTYDRVEPEGIKRNDVEPTVENTEQRDTGAVDRRQSLRQHSSNVALSFGKDKSQNMSVDEPEYDSVFDENGITNSSRDVSTISKYVGVVRNTVVSEASNRLVERQKRKARKNHGDAPPHKVRGSSVAVDTTQECLDRLGQSTGASPCLREPQPSRLDTLNNTHSSDDFEPAKPQSRQQVKRSSKRRKNTSEGQDKASSIHVSPSGAIRRISPRKRAGTSQIARAESTNSEQDFQMDKSSVRHKSCESNPGSSKKQKRKQQTKKIGKQSDQDNTATQDKNEAYTSVNQILPRVMERERQGEGESVNGHRENGNDKGGCDNVRQDPVITEHDETRNDRNTALNVTNINEQSLELVFRSDLGFEESDFLGFSAEEIEETEIQTESFKRRETGQLYSQKLEAAALNVYCLPSSDPCPDVDENSSADSLGEFTIGLVLQKVVNFPSEGSEWEEQVTGYMKKLDTELEIKKRRESEISTLPSPNFTRHLEFGNQKVNQGAFQSVLEDLGPEHISDNDNDEQVFEADITEACNRNDDTENVILPAVNNIPCGDELDSTVSSKTFHRRRSARLHGPSNLRPVTRSSSANQVSYSGMCSSPSKKHRSTSANMNELVQKTGHKQALRELSSNQVPQSPQQYVDPAQCSTPKKTRPNFGNTLGSPAECKNDSHIVFPPGTPYEEQQEILENYVHDDSESEVVFPKFSSPVQADSIFSPMRHHVKHQAKVKRRRRQSAPCLGHRDVQSSPIRPSHRDSCLPFGLPSSRKSLFMKGHVKHIHISSPSKCSRSSLHSPRKCRRSSVSSPMKRSSPILSFLNELRAGLSPTFYTFKKPHFSLSILQPSAVRGRHYRTRMSRSLFALNLCLPSEEELRIYEFHDDSSIDEEEGKISPNSSGKKNKEFRDRCTQTPPSCKKGKTKPRRLSLGHKRRPVSTSAVTDRKAKNKGGSRKSQEVEHVNENSRTRSIKVQASSPDVDTIFDMPLDYYR